jgi:molybdopterin molybdotransferase
LDFRFVSSYHFHVAVSTQVPTVVSFEDAHRVIKEHASLLRGRGRELVPLLDAACRVLAETITADRDFPPFPRAARDGYAVRSLDTENVPATLEVIGEIKAGAAQLPELGPGQAVAIMTGASAPEGSDAVVMIEHTSRADDRVQVNKSVSQGENIVPAGSESRRGETLLQPGTRLGYAEVAVGAAVGRPRVLVYSKPRVAVLATGDEVVDLDVPPGPTQIRNSNSYSLAAQIQAAGAEPIPLPIAPDEPARLRELLAEGFETDLVLIAGGVSMGKYDLVEQILAEFHAEFFFTGALIQPGKPIVFGRVPAEDAGAQAKYFFGLPGNPISTMVTFELFVRPLINALAGATPVKLHFLHAKLKSPIKTKTGLKRFLPAVLSGEFEKSEVELVKWQGSGDIASAARANCFVVIPSDRERIETGEWVPVLLKSSS